MLQSNLQSMKWSNFYLDSRLSARMVSSSTNQKMNIVTNELVEQHEETTNDLMLSNRKNTGFLYTRRKTVMGKQNVKEVKRNEAEVVVVNPKVRKGLTSMAIDWIESLIVRYMYDSSVDHHWLSGNFAPVLDEAPPCTNLPVIGHLPDCLNGAFLRVGPNPKYPPVAGYHWFDGDGMIHGLRIKDGNATYVSRYVKTSRLKQEETYGGAKFIKVGDLKGLFGLLMLNMQILREKLEVLDMSYGYGTANTAMIYHHGKLMALSEGDKPYVIGVKEDGDLQTLGLLDFDKRLTHSFTAHPKVDPCTGKCEMFTFGYSQTHPYLTYRVISKDGFINDPVTITLPRPVLMHDFAITENYVIIMDLPLYIKPKEMVKEKKLIFTFDATKKARFGVLPRYAKNDSLIKWFELPNCFIFHNANAWEEGDDVVLITCRVENPDFTMNNESMNGKLEDSNNELFEMRFNMKSGRASQKKLSASAVEFPRINESYTGRKQRYVYGTVSNHFAKVSGIVKFDLHMNPEMGKRKIKVGGNIQGIFDLGPGIFGSEAIFIPRKPNITSEEDDGYLIHFLHNENTGKSAINVIDARTMSPDPVAVVELPYRVPYGFHALFMSEEQLQEQAEL
ncbi:carotenoid 9,10(9',10')-cleavage dioxygenase 1-like isoform X2 [Daucus carota subsp. sativus]|uniref:carotenoid 9,10(9',10')-cleavage dioxygenase 1-like isoform X2 n=1 Tax=Daucus carota subsp. sativus TaxID=79200 RepID=UPI0007EF02E0|nr:PREDICTED: carotenoid 9,10(9',10')-cleavage dioxygenase 1-like isoform X1 [Daucus carota subsp. sativus]